MLRILAIITCALSPTCAAAQVYDPYYDRDPMPRQRPSWEPDSPYYQGYYRLNPNHRYAPNPDFFRGRREYYGPPEFQPRRDSPYR